MTFGSRWSPRVKITQLRLTLRDHWRWQIAPPQKVAPGHPPRHAFCICFAIFVHSFAFFPSCLQPEGRREKPLRCGASLIIFKPKKFLLLSSVVKHLRGEMLLATRLSFRFVPSSYFRRSDSPNEPIMNVMQSFAGVECSAWYSSSRPPQHFSSLGVTPAKRYITWDHYRSFGLPSLRSASGGR